MTLAVVKREFHTLEHTWTDKGIRVDREDVTFADGSVMKKYIPREDSMKTERAPETGNGLKPGYRELAFERRVQMLELQIQQLKGTIARLEKAK